MQFWNTIINTALLGTDKKQVAAKELPPGLMEIADTVSQVQGIDKEEQFLHLASAAYNYRQSGSTPLHKEDAALPVAAAETLPYCSTRALQALNDILAEDNHSLLMFWLQQCSTAQRLVTPDLIPKLLDMAVQNKPLRTSVKAVCGRRGEWLSRFNTQWQFSADTSGEDLWQTGTAEQRRTILKQLRQQEPAKGRELLMQSWALENANSKAELLKQFSGTVGTDDREWLESLLEEKSVKVKDEVIQLLKQLPGSSIIEKYWQVLQQAVQLKKERALLGLSSKISLQIALPAGIDEDIFKTGIEKLSNNKALTDEAYILFQLMRCIPPTYWEKHFTARRENVLAYFQKEHKQFVPALVNAVVRFNDLPWAICFMQHSEVFYIDIIPLLPAEQQEFYSLRFFEQHPDSIIQYARQRQGAWSLELTRAIFRHAAKNPYHYNRSFYNENIYRIPTGIVTELDKCNPAEVPYQAMWASISGHIARLASIKQQTINAFNE